MRVTAFFLSLFLFTGCEVPAPDPLDYDATCQVDSDCALVNISGDCGFDCGSTQVLNSQAAPDFQAAETRYVEHHRCSTNGLVACPPSDRTATPRCDQGQGQCVVDWTP